MIMYIYKKEREKKRERKKETNRFIYLTILYMEIEYMGHLKKGGRKGIERKE